MEDIMIHVIIGVILLMAAYAIGYKKKINLLHKYHYNNVHEKDRAIFCKYMGIGLFVSAIGILSIPLINFVFKTTIGFSIGLSIVCLGLIILILITIKYNDKLFAFHKKRI